MEKQCIIPAAPKMLMQILIDAGYQAYVVGGCVRDSLLGKVPHDWDICTDALPEQMQKCFKEYRVIETGLKHGTLTVMDDDVGYEITTFRVDGDYSDHRHPDSVKFVGNLKEDLQRRDFTMNAMAADMSGKIIDYFNGMSDLSCGYIQCVGNANDRFQEDALRILRALRFVSRYDFHIRPETEKAMLENRNLLLSISPERINHELSEILLGTFCYNALNGYEDIYAVFIPEIAKCVGFEQHSPYHLKSVWNHTIAAIQFAPKDLYVRLALLYHDIGKPECFTMVNRVGHFYGHAAISRIIAEKSLRNLRYDNKTIQFVTQLVESHDITIVPDKKVIRRCLNKLGVEQFYRLLDLKAADDMGKINLNERLQKSEIKKLTEEILEAQRQQQECFSLKDLAINGDDLLGIGYKPGKLVGYCLNTLLSAVIDGILENDKESLLQFARKYMCWRIQNEYD